MSESKPTPAQAWRELVEKATPIANARLTRYEHGGGRYFVPLPSGGGDLIADFYGDSANRELFVAQRRVAEALVEWIAARGAFEGEAFQELAAHAEALGRYHAADEALYAACVEAVGAKP